MAQINELRQKAGAGPLTLDPAFTDIAAGQLQSLVQEQPLAGEIEQSFDQVLEQASNAALPGFQRVFAMSAAGPATPEDVIAMWIENDDSGNLTDPDLRAAGVGYLFAEQDEYRHYWLLLLGG